MFLYLGTLRASNFLIAHPMHLDMSVLVSTCPRSLQHGETVEQAAHRSCGYPIPGRAQGQVGWDSKESEGVLIYSREVGTRRSLIPLLT